MLLISVGHLNHYLEHKGINNRILKKIGSSDLINRVI